MTRTLVLQNTSQTDLAALLPGRSEGVRMPFGQLKRVEKVVGVGSLARFLGVNYRQLGELMARYVGHVYHKGALSTWATVERCDRLPRKWYKKYWMPEAVEREFKSFIRRYVFWVSGQRYAARVTGTHRWRVTLRKV